MNVLNCVAQAPCARWSQAHTNFCPQLLRCPIQKGMYYSHAQLSYHKLKDYIPSFGQTTGEQERTEPRVIKHSLECLRDCCIPQTLNSLVTYHLFISQVHSFLAYPISLIKPEASGVGKSR